MMMMNLRMIAEGGWSEETTYDVEEYKKKGIKSSGQCYITARALQIIFGWEILHHHDEVEGDHYWNRLPDGREVDFTSDQFDGNGLNKMDGWDGRPFQVDTEHELYRGSLARLNKYLQIVERPMRNFKEEICTLCSGCRRDEDDSC